MSILGILIPNFPLPFGILTPTVTSGINKFCLFNIIGSSTFPLNIVLIFNGEISGIPTFGELILPSIFPPIFILGIPIFGILISKLFLIFISPSIF